MADDEKIRRDMLAEAERWRLGTETRKDRVRAFAFMVPFAIVALLFIILTLVLGPMLAGPHFGG